MANPIVQWDKRGYAPAIDPASLAGQVNDLETRHDEAMSLLGEVLATLRLDGNQNRLAESEVGRELNRISDTWWRKFQHMKD